MNQHLLYDLIRAKRGRAVIMSNDAWGCYNRIAHIAILLALWRLGIPRPPILAMLETIQKMQHYIRTLFPTRERVRPTLFSILLFATVST